MLIKIQDQNKLVNLNRMETIDVFSVADDCWRLDANIGSIFHVLGAYPSKERALNVLNMIYLLQAQKGRIFSMPEKDYDTPPIEIINADPHLKGMVM